MKIEIEQLTFKCIIGILDFERVKKQKVIINLSFDYDFNKDNFIDYSEVANLVKKSMKKNEFELLEDAVKTIKKVLEDSYTIKNLKLKISKPNILKDCIVSISS
ncbi:dihydroneopterin aldolase [Aliarcobacter cryaerophilus]|jgi:dihydroneopterin aldolase|uniref:dihydroneopterin aldolase n=1 Tax=Aliarcobacter cryaerophilus TaxID=28198 RepID=A0A2S9TPP4_9BACT|nr:dihydroneopterin aldolase [Aliarcobacter cryaerophilus]MDX9815107.1 dihydroneopterin aldolase [Sulfurimonadaceae bacterium]PRN00812.1 dihydroneopterin aldolase [Arcobacter cryaerophilus gv. pseudocryaerophilus]